MLQIWQMAMAVYIQKLIDGFAKKEVIVFCGAGISFNSGIPVVWDIKSKILDTFSLGKDEKDRILKYPQPFEAFMETIIERTNPLPLFRMFEYGEPNTTHRFLANMAKNQLIDTVVTTNFDKLIETAMDDECVDYDLIYEDIKLQDLKLGDGRVRIIKLHGSIHDKNEMALTIKKVAENDSVYSRKKAIDEIIAHPKYKSIWVIGYSCSDVFDINPCIFNQANKKKYIFYLKHSQGNSSLELDDDISSKLLPHPFESYSGITETCNTDDVIKTIWGSVLSVSYPNMVFEKMPWENAVNDWVRTAVENNSSNVLDYLAGSLFKYSADFKASNKYLLKAVNSEKIEDNKKLTVYAYQAIGDNYRDTGNYPDAIRYFKKAMILARNLEMSEAQCFAINSIGIVYEDQKKHDRAIRQHQSALDLARKLSLKKMEGKVLGNIGIVFKNKSGENNLKKAINHQNKALKIARDVGDKRSEGRTLGNLAIAYSDLGDKSTAIGYYKEAYKIALDLADAYHQAVWKANMGMDYIGLDDGAAEKYLKQAIEQFQEIGSQHYVEYCKEKLQELYKQKA